ncbi:helix-turn-helix domain-containing protein [Runella salmonicolor]|uniref:helix-turn-helix domain-containing protein n=1 Tax=Runella salmonicolor TaxID=2950278 RepID=UPI0035B64696
MSHLITNVQNRLQDVIRQRENEGFPFKPSNQFYRGLGIHKRRFGQFLRNEKQPNLEELARLANCFNVNPKDLF